MNSQVIAESAFDFQIHESFIAHISLDLPI